LGTSTRLGRSPVNQFERIQADIYGRWPVLESLRAGNVTRIYLAAGVRDTADHLQEIQTLAAEQHIPVSRVDRFALDNILGGMNHQGIAAAAKPFTYTSFEDLMASTQRHPHQPLLVLFDNVQDPQNLGSILRTAEAVGADGAVLPKHNQAGVTPAVIRASAGAVEHLKVAEVTNLRQGMAKLKEAGYWIVGLDMEGGTDYDNFDVESPIALVIGGEGKGLSRLIGEECDYLVRLPMRGRVGSLNASVAAGIVLYEIGRRRGFPETARPASEPVVAEIPTDVVARKVGAVPVEDEVELDDAYTEDFVSEEIDEIAALNHDEEEKEELVEEGDFDLLDADEAEAEDEADEEVADEAGDGKQQ
jgi:23S rRNA (guanosine2251-2'-O)-methyltransferase